MARISPLVALPPLVFAALAVLFYTGMMREDPNALPSTFENRPAPAVALEPLGTKPQFDSAMLEADGVKLVNFWASWCAPCRIEHPHLQTLSDEGVPIYGVNYKDAPANALGFLRELGDPYTAIGADSGGRMGLDWGLYGVPETFVIDGNGRVVLRFAGPVTEAVLEERIRPAISDAASR